jgi:hypothetical protein
MGNVFICVYRHLEPNKKKIREIKEASFKTPLLNTFLETYHNDNNFYDWGDDPSFFAAKNYLGNEKFATWGVCRANVRRQLKQDDIVIFICGKEYNKCWDYYFIGYYAYKYGYPTPVQKEINLLTSSQLAIDYNYKKNNTKVQAAIFLKKEGAYDFIAENQIEKITKTVIGAEIFLAQNFFEKWEASVSNTFLNVKDSYNGKRWIGSNNFPYFFKLRMMYANPLLATVSLAFITRPGTFYMPIVGSSISPDINDVYIPQYGEYNSFKYNDYGTLDLSFIKLFRIQKKSAIIFLNITNLLNRDNQNSEYYNNNYTQFFFNNFQKRALYAGLVLKF